MVRKFSDAIRPRIAPRADVDTVDGEVAAAADGEEDVHLGSCEAIISSMISIFVEMLRG